MKTHTNVLLGILLATTVLTSCAQNKIAAFQKSEPVTLEELALLKKTLLWSAEDDKYLKDGWRSIGRPA